MDPGDKESITQTLDALERLMRMFQAERIIYLFFAAASFGLLLYAAFLMFSSDGGVTAGQIALIFGATGASAVSGGRIAYFLNKSFSLIEDVVRKLTGVGPRRDP